MKYFFILLTILVSGNTVQAQTAEDSVKAVVNKMFAAMKNADAEALKSCFADSMVLQTIISRGAQVKVKNENTSGFVEMIKKEQPGNADERITFETVKIDGPLALVWTPYSFYYKEKFSHCGVNSFHLVRFNGEWKIQYLIDTRRREGCVGQ